MSFRIRPILAGIAVSGLLVAGSATMVTAVGPAGAAGPAGKGVCATQATAARANATVETLRAFGDCEINRRFTTLDKLAAKVSSSKVLTSSHAAALTAKIGAARSGLTALKATIDSEAAIPALKADIVKIATDFRVYVLLAPQVHLTNAADGVAAAQTRFNDVSTRLTARIAAAKAAGKDTTVAQGHLDAMNAAVTRAVGLAQPIPGKVLPLTPADWNSGAAGPVLNQARTDLVAARNQLRTAVAEAQACRLALKALR
jgi:hypothetical protein